MFDCCALLFAVGSTCLAFGSIPAASSAITCGMHRRPPLFDPGVKESQNLSGAPGSQYLVRLGYYFAWASSGMVGGIQLEHDLTERRAVESRESFTNSRA